MTDWDGTSSRCLPGHWSLHVPPTAGWPYGIRMPDTPFVMRSMLSPSSEKGRR